MQIQESTPKTTIAEKIKHSVSKTINKEVELAQEVLKGISDLYYYDFLDCPRDKTIAKAQKSQRDQKIELANNRFNRHPF